MANKVKLQKIVEKMNLKNLTPDLDLSEKGVEIPDINRPALQLTGFFEHFDSERVQIIGYVEYTFLEKMEEGEKKKIYETLLSYKRGYYPAEPEWRCFYPFLLQRGPQFYCQG